MKGTDEGGPTTSAPMVLGAEYSPSPRSLTALTHATMRSPISRLKVVGMTLIEIVQVVVVKA